MSDIQIPFDPDFDVPKKSGGSSNTYFVFGVLAGLTMAAAIGIIVVKTF